MTTFGSPTSGSGTGSYSLTTSEFATTNSERQALLTHGVGCFMLTSGNRTKWDQMRIVAKAWDRIQEVIAKTPRPFIHLVHGDGTPEALSPPPTKTARPP